MCSFQSVLNNEMALDQVGCLLIVDDKMICINRYKIELYVFNLMTFFIFSGFGD